ncbi:MAG: DNA gyrase modulator, partial [Bacteroidales bacterium]|nr:DNA gyrase modulator [Bacteroidales bacterium]
MADTSYYLKLFQVDLQRLEHLVGEALRKGGSYCDLYFESTSYSDLLLRDGVVSSGGFHVDYGCGIRVLCGEKTGYSYTESTTPEALAEAARCAGAIASGAEALSCPRCGCSRVITGLQKAFYGMEEDWREVQLKRHLPFLERLESEIRSRDSRVVKVIAMLSDQVSD